MDLRMVIRNFVGSIPGLGIRHQNITRRLFIQVLTVYDVDWLHGSAVFQLAQPPIGVWSISVKQLSDKKPLGRDKKPLEGYDKKSTRARRTSSDGDHKRKIYHAKLIAIETSVKYLIDLNNIHVSALAHYRNFLAE